MKFLSGAAFLLLVSATASAQDDERVKRIVERIEKEIRESHERTREEIRAIIRAEIQKGGKPADPAPGKPAAPARKVTLGISAGDMTEEEREEGGDGGLHKVFPQLNNSSLAGCRRGVNGGCRR